MSLICFMQIYFEHSEAGSGPRPSTQKIVERRNDFKQALLLSGVNPNAKVVLLLESGSFIGGVNFNLKSSMFSESLLTAQMSE